MIIIQLALYIFTFTTRENDFYYNCQLKCQLKLSTETAIPIFLLIAKILIIYEFLRLIQQDISYPRNIINQSNRLN